MLTPSLKLALLGSWLALPALSAAQTPAPERFPIQENIPHEAPSQEVLDQVHSWSQDRWNRVYTQETDTAFWARGKTYKASFDGERAAYFPLLGPDKPRLFGFGLQSPTLTVGGKSIPLKAEVTPQGTDTEVRMDRGALTEWYRLSPTSIEQLFTLDAPVGEGALTVAIPVESELLPVPSKGGFLFRNEFGGVHYGAATVLDATGRSQSAETRWINGELRIEVPESFLATAQWPVTIDPVITTWAVDTWVDDLTNPDIAYDLTNDRILVTYEESAAGADRDIYWTIINLSDQTSPFNGYWDSTTENWYRPRVANNNFSNNFLVVAEQDFGTFRQVGYRMVNAATGVQGNIQGVSAIEFVSNEMPDVGGEVVNAGTSYFLITWIEDNFFGARRVVSTRVNQDGICQFDDFRLYTGTEPANDPAVCNSAGSSGVFHVAYSVGLPGNRHIRGASVAWSGTIAEADHSIANLAGDLARPSVTGRLTSDGDRYMVVFEEIQSASVVDIVAAVCQGSSTLFVQNLTDQGGVNLSQLRQHPSVDHDGERFGVAWSEYRDSSNSYDVLASTFVLAGDNLCESESRVHFDDPGSGIDEFAPAICSLFGAGGPSGSTYAAWSVSESSSNIFAAHYQLNPTNCIGRAYCNPAVANSSGQLGRTFVTGSHVATGGFITLNADQLPPNQFGYFLCGTSTASFIPPGSQGRFCLGGQLGRFNRSASEILNSGPFGSFNLSINTLTMPTNPNQAILAGQNWYFQAWHRDLNPGQTSNFARATEVQFE